MKNCFKDWRQSKTLFVGFVTSWLHFVEKVLEIPIYITLLTRYHFLLLQVLFGQQELYPKRLFSSGMCPCQWEMGTVAGKGLKLCPSSEGVGRHTVFCVDPVGVGISVNI